MSASMIGYSEHPSAGLNPGSLELTGKQHRLQVLYMQIFWCDLLDANREVVLCMLCGAVTIEHPSTGFEDLVVVLSNQCKKTLFASVYHKACLW